MSSEQIEEALAAFVRSKQKGTDSGNYQRNARRPRGNRAHAAAALYSASQLVREDSDGALSRISRPQCRETHWPRRHRLNRLRPRLALAVLRPAGALPRPLAQSYGSRGRENAIRLRCPLHDNQETRREDRAAGRSAERRGPAITGCRSRLQRETVSRRPSR